MSTLENTADDWKPATTSTGIALAGTAAVVLALLWQVDDVFRPVALGAVGAGLFALSCWLLSQDRLETAARPVVSVLALPVALGLFGSTAVVTLLLASRLFPVTDGSLFSTTALVITGHAGVVFGSVLALLGATLGVWSVVTPTTLRRYAHTAFLTALVPGLFCVALVVEVVVFAQEGPLTAGLDLAALVWTWVTAAEPTGLDLAGFLFTVALAVTAVLAAVVVLPVAELRDDPAAKQRVVRLRRGLVLASLLAMGLHLLFLWLEVRHQDGELATLLGPALYGLLEAVGTARGLRVLLLTVAVVALAGSVLGILARRLARQSRRGLARTAGPFAGGAFITLIAVTVAELVYETLLDLILQSLPPATEADVAAMSTEATTLYGEELFVALLAFALVTATLCFIVLVRVALYFGTLSAEASGFSLASTGLLLSVVAAATIGAPAWLVFGGVLGSLLVWDTGRFGTRLGKEMGPHTGTRETELVHAGATVGVGLVGVGTAGALVSRAGSVWTLPPGTTSVALVALAVGLVCFVVALR